MPKTALRLALVDADELCQRELARRTCREALCIDSSQLTGDQWLSKCDAVAFLGSSARDDWIARGIEAKKHVLVGSEVLTTRDRLTHWTSSAKASGALFDVGNALQHLPSRQLIAEQLESGKLGEPGMVRVHRWGGAGQERVPLSASVPRQALNELHQVIRCFGQAPERVFAVELPSDGGCAMHLGFTGGGMALLDCAVKLPEGDDYASFSVIGSRGAVYSDDQQNIQLLYRGGEPRGLRAGEPSSPSALMVGAFAGAIDAFQANPSADVPQRAWRNTALWSDCLATMEAIVESLRTRQACVPRN